MDDDEAFGPREGRGHFFWPQFLPLAFSGTMNHKLSPVAKRSDGG